MEQSIGRNETEEVGGGKDGHETANGAADDIMVTGRKIELGDVKMLNNGCVEDREVGRKTFSTFYVCSKDNYYY